MGRDVPSRGMEGTAQVGDARVLERERRISLLSAQSNVTGRKASLDIWDVIVEEGAATYHVPMTREVVIAMRDEGKSFVAWLLVAANPCLRCGGRGVLMKECMNTFLQDGVNTNLSAKWNERVADGKDFSLWSFVAYLLKDNRVQNKTQEAICYFNCTNSGMVHNRLETLRRKR